ncbi:hypothetical protein [Streptomyces prunicolor]|uniref:hypothetical protein n=1 Tax=Streptomyces prunicolor TaxID=67348 RepID=UPI0003698AB8|nr:hypothetical protein [Streptomyces prunicolor]
MISGSDGRDSPPTSAPVIDDPPRRTVRRAVDLWRLLVSLAVLLVAVLLAVATRDFVRAAQQGLLTTATALPPALRDALVGTVQAVALLAPVVALVVWCVRRRAEPVLRVLPAAALGALGAWALTHLALVRGRPDAWPGVLDGRDGLVRAGWPSAVYLAACAAAVVAAGPWLGARPRRALWFLAVGCGALSVATAAIVPLDAVAALAVGGAAGSAVLLLAGAPTDRPPIQAVADALADSGIAVARLSELPPDEQHLGEGTVYRAVTTAGSRLAVRVLASEDHNRDLFHRLARRTLLRHPADATAQLPLGAAEHELLMLVFAARTGARVDEPVMACPVAGAARWWRRSSGIPVLYLLCRTRS